MTPSEWHDDAHTRDAGHDDMQAGVFRDVDQHFLAFRMKGLHNETVEYDRKWVNFERPFYSQGKIITFVDACVLFDAGDNMNARHKQVLFCYEIKPKIYSVGAIIRQLRATENAIHNGKHYRINYNDYNPTPRINVIAVIPYDDPKKDLLAEFWPDVMLWHGHEKGCSDYKR